MEDFLYDFAKLLAKHNASIFYTNDDDGIHFKIGKEEVAAHLGDNPLSEIESLLFALAQSSVSEDNASSDNQLASAIKERMAMDLSAATANAGRVYAIPEVINKEPATDGK